MHAFLLEPVVRAALLEDLSHGTDLTTDAIAGADQRATAHIVARSAGTIYGHGCARAAFTLLDSGSEYTAHVPDGGTASGDQRVATISARARAVLTAERTALNFLCRLSGIATATRALADLVAEYPARVIDTRKTTPGLRALEKAAVLAGGGANHRFGLDDGVLIKDNHIAVAGSISAAVAAVRKHTGHMVKIEVEVDTLGQLREALELNIDAVLLDNMPPEQLREAVQLVAGRVVTEASGGITPQRIASVAATGVDLISVGWITHSAPALDLGLDITL